jgi:hypothetical protein
VSPLWQDEVAIGFAPGRIELMRWARGLKPTLTEAQVVQPAGAGNGGGAAWANWTEAVGALSGALADARWQRARARVVVSSHYTRFAVIDGAAELASDDERAAFVDLRYRSIYGERAEDWQLACTPFAGSGRAVACAVDRHLLDALRECAASARLAVASVQPYLVAAFNVACESVRGEQVWFVAVEEGRIAMAAFAQDQWVGVRCEPAGDDVAESIAAMLAQDVLARGSGDGECRAYVCAPRWEGRLVAPGPGWTMQRVAQLPADRRAALVGGRAFEPSEYPLTAATQRQA